MLAYPGGHVLAAPRVGRCATCGRQAPGSLLTGSLRECEGPCPRCGTRPFYLDGIAPYTGNIAAMSEGDALAFLDQLDNPAEVEVCFRLELLGHAPEGRERVLIAAYSRYWQLAWLEDPYARAKILTLAECRAAWWKELGDPEARRMYEGLLRAT